MSLGIQITEEEVESWEAWLEDFKNLVYPKIFQQHGFTFQEATHLWMTNRLHNRVDALVDALREEDDGFND